MSDYGERLANVEARVAGVERDITALEDADRRHEEKDAQQFRELRTLIREETGKIYNKLDEKKNNQLVNQWGLVVALIGIIATLVVTLVK